MPKNKLTKKTKEEVKIYSLTDAIEQLKKDCKCKFDSTMELHINLNLDPKKQEQSIRFTTVLPHGTGKTKKVAVLASKKISNADLELAESDIEKIEKLQLKPKVDFDVLVAEPKFMSKLARVAKILGPAGLMPNPKTGTVSDDPEAAVAMIKKGKVEIRMEQNSPIIHTIIGKRSFDSKNLENNFLEIVSMLKQNRPQKAKPDWIKSLYLTTTMSKSVKLDLSLL